MNLLNQVSDRNLNLVGGTVLTRVDSAPSADNPHTSPNDVWSYPNLHGDVSGTADGNGTKTGSTRSNRGSIGCLTESYSRRNADAVIQRTRGLDR